MVCHRKHVLVIDILFYNGSFPNLERLSYADIVAMGTQTVIIFICLF